jgi:hypothetical protein
MWTNYYSRCVVCVYILWSPWWWLISSRNICRGIYDDIIVVHVLVKIKPIIPIFYLSVPFYYHPPIYGYVFKESLPLRFHDSSYVCNLSPPPCMLHERTPWYSYYYCCYCHYHQEYCCCWWRDNKRIIAEDFTLQWCKLRCQWTGIRALLPSVLKYDHLYIWKISPVSSASFFH